MINTLGNSLSMKTEEKRRDLENSFVNAVRSASGELPNLLERHLQETSAHFKRNLVKMAAKEKLLSSLNTLLRHDNIFAAVEDELIIQEDSLFFALISLFHEYEEEKEPLKLAQYKPIIDRFKQLPMLAFLIAANENDTQALSKLLESHGENFSSIIRLNGLNAAVQNGHLDNFVLLFKSYGHNLTEYEKEFLLINTALMGERHIVLYLLPHCHKLQNLNSLYPVAQKGKVEIFSLLLNKFYSKLSVVDALELMITTQDHNNVEIVESLLATSPQFTEDKSSQVLKVIDSLKMLVQKNATHPGKYQEIIDWLAKIPAVAFIKAVIENDLKQALALLKTNVSEIEPSVKNKALFHAVEIVNLTVLNTLLDDPSFLAVVTNDRNAILDKAKKIHEDFPYDNNNRCKPIVQRLMQIPAVQLIDLCDAWGQDEEKLKALLEQDSANISSEVKGQALYLAIDKMKLKQISILLNQCGNEISEEDKSKTLQKAVETQDLRSIYLLLSHPAMTGVVTRLTTGENQWPLFRAFCSLIDEKASEKDHKKAAYYSLIIKKISQIPSLSFYLAVKDNNVDILPDMFKRYTFSSEIIGTGLVCAARNYDSEELLNTLLIFAEETIRESNILEAMRNAVLTKHAAAAYALVTNHRVLEAISRTLSPDEAIYLLRVLEAYFEKKQSMGLEDTKSYQLDIKQILMVPSLAFYGAILNNDVEAITQILDKHKSEIKENLIQEGFLLAVKKGQLEVVCFMQHRFEEILKNHMQRALEIAAAHDQVKIVNVLLSDSFLFATIVDSLAHHADLIPRNILFLVEKEGMQNTIEVAEYQPVMNKKKKIPALVFLNALKNNQSQIVLALLDLYTIPEYIKERAFWLAAQNNLAFCLAILLKHCDFKSNSSYLGTALQIASRNGHLENVTLLLDYAGLKISNRSKATALNEASIAGQLQVVKLLLDKCDDIFMNDKAQALRKALQYGQTQIALYLLERFGDEMKREDKGCTLVLASSIGNLEVLSALLNYSTEMCIADKETALCLAANVEILIRLLSHIREIAGFKGEALVKASTRGNLEIVRYLLEHFGTEIYHHKLNAFKHAIESENMQLISLLFPQDEDAFDEGLRVAVRHGKPKILTVLFDLDQSENLSRSISQSFALEEAAKKGDAEIVRILLQHCVKTLSRYNVKHLIALAVESCNLATVEEFLSNESIVKLIRWEDYSLFINAQKLAQKHEDGALYQLIVDRLLQTPLFALYYAITNRHIEALSTLLNLHTHEISQVDMNSAMRVAFANNDIEILRLLLTHFGSGMLPRDRRDLLENATVTGELELLNVLLEDNSFQIEAAINSPTLMYRAQMALLSHDSPGLQRVIERLEELNAEIVNRNTQTMAQRAQHNENSMQALSKNQIVLVNVLKKHYESAYLDKSWEVILVEIVSYLEAEYAKSPAKDTNGENLPLTYREDLTPEQLKAYYQHRIHTAWRYLSIPNPWIAESSYATLLEDGTRFANIYDDDKELICYLWLALNDETVLLDEGFTIAGNKYVFAQSLGCLGRAHNYDKNRPVMDENNQPKIDDKGEIVVEYYDDLEGDKPTCEMGVTQRLLEAAYGHPYIQDPAARPLSSIIIIKHMLQKLITHKEKVTDSDNLFDRLGKLPVVILKAIHFEISELLFLFEGESERALSEEENQSKMVALTIPENQLKEFIENIKLFFMPNRINDKTSVKHNAFKHLDFKGYIPFVQHCAKNPLIAFSEQIYALLKTKIGTQLIEAKQSNFTPAFNANASAKETAGKLSEKGESNRSDLSVAHETKCALRKG